MAGTYGSGTYGSGVYGGTPDTSAFRAVCGPSNPSIMVEFDYQNDPTSTTQTWTDITPYVVSYSRQPVRTNEFDQPVPAAATITLRNDNGYFTPDNTSGPFYGGLKKYRRFRVRALWNGVIYNRYWGFATDWPQSWDDAGLNQSVTLQLVDNLFPLETCDLQGQTFTSKLSGAAIGDVLLAAGVTAYTLDAGNSTIVATAALPTGSYAAQRLRDIAASENGVVYADGAGIVNFHDRRRRLTGGQFSSTVQATIGDGGGNEIPYTDPQPEFGDVWSTVQVTPNNGTVQVASSSAGQSAFFNQTLNFPTGGTYLVADRAEALAAAQYLLNRYSSPNTQIPSVRLVGAAQPNSWPQILALDISARVVFKRRLLSNGVVANTISLNQFVEGYGDDVTIGSDWRVTVALSPADLQNYWILGDATYGLLGTTTRSGY